MENKKIKDIIKEYKEKNPSIGYFTISDIFGLTPKYILETLGYKKFYINKDSINISNEAGFIVYNEKKHSNVWCVYEYNKNNQLIKYYNNDGYVQTWQFNELGLEMLYKDSEGDWSISEYDEKGNMVEFSTPDIVYTSKDLSLLL